MLKNIIILPALLLFILTINLRAEVKAESDAVKQMNAMSAKAEAAKAPNIRKGFYVAGSAGYGYVGKYTVADEAYVSFLFIPLSARDTSSENHMKPVKNTFVPTLSLGYEGVNHGIELQFRYDNIDTRSSGYGYTLDDVNYAEHISMESKILMLNYSYKFSNSTPLTPYLGLGAGYGWTTTNWEIKNEAGEVINLNEVVNGGRHYGTFNYALFVGAQYNLSENVTLGLDVNYMIRSGLRIEKKGVSGQFLWLQGGAGINRETGFVSDVTTVSLKLKYYFM